MSKILQFERQNEGQMNSQLATFSFTDKPEPSEENRSEKVLGETDNAQLVLKEKSTHVDSEKENEEVDFDIQNDSFILDQEMVVQEEHKFQLDDDSNDPIIQFEISDDVSEVGDILFSPKTYCMQTDIGSPLADCFPKEMIGIPSIKELQIYMKNSDLFQTEAAKKSQIRREKVERYFLKKQNRCFTKKVAYHSRKTVAESRLRIKGRFITKFQAEKILGTDLSHLCNKDIKQLLDHHYAHWC